MNKGEQTKSIKSVELTDFILLRVSNGESLRSVCRDSDMPHISNFLRWVAEDDVLREQYTRAMEVRADLIFDEMTDIADDATNDFMDKLNQDGSIGDKVLNSEHVQRSRLRIDTRKWILSRMNPKKYGDAVNLKHSGDAANPVALLINQVQGSAIGIASGKEDGE